MDDRKKEREVNEIFPLTTIDGSSAKLIVEKKSLINYYYDVQLSMI